MSRIKLIIHRLQLLNLSELYTDDSLNTVFVFHLLEVGGHKNHTRSTLVQVTLKFLKGKTTCVVHVPGKIMQDNNNYARIRLHKTKHILTPWYKLLFHVQYMLTFYQSGVRCKFPNNQIP